MDKLKEKNSIEKALKWMILVSITGITKEISSRIYLYSYFCIRKVGIF